MNIAGQERPVGQLATRKPKPFSNLTHHFVKASKITGLVPTDVLVAVFFACFRQDTLVLCPLSPLLTLVFFRDTDRSCRSTSHQRLPRRGVC